MKAIDLVALASAHGINFIHVAGSASKVDGIARPRCRTRVEIEEGITDIPQTVKGKGSRVARAPAYSHAELGIAAHGVKALAWSAAQHTIANDRTTLTLKVLHGGLMYNMSKFSNQYGWELMVPARIVRDPNTQRRVASTPREAVFYREALCMLVLDEISFRPAFAAVPALYAIYMGIEESTWEEKLLERFKILQMRYAMWFGEGMRLIQQGISGERCDERPAA